MSQEALAKAVGITQSTLAAAESSGHGSRVTPQLAHVCKVNCYWLATGEGLMTAPESWLIADTAEHHVAEAAATYTTVRQVLERLNTLLGTTPPERREALAALLSGWAREGTSSIYPSVVAPLLDGDHQIASDASHPADEHLGGNSKLGELDETTPKQRAPRRRAS